MSPDQFPAIDIGSGYDDKFLHELTHAVPRMSTWDVAEMDSYGKTSSTSASKKKNLAPCPFFTWSTDVMVYF